MKIEALQQTATIIRKQILDMVYHAGSGHLGGSFSAVEILTDLYFSQMNIDPQRPDWELRDRFVLSKGHATPVYDAVLAERGYFPKADLVGFRQIDSYLQGHPDKKHTPGVDMSTGSLGQGLSVAVGMALAGKMRRQDYRVYALLGDGEIQEGQIWEALQFAGNQQLDNLVVILDNNHIQSDGTLQEVNSPYPIDAKSMVTILHSWRPPSSSHAGSKESRPPFLPRPSREKASPLWKTRLHGMERCRTKRSISRL